MEPLALELIAAPLLQNHDVRIVDLKIEGDLTSEIIRFKPDLVGLTAYTMEVPEVLAIANTIKTLSPEIVTVIGGFHATMFPDTFRDSRFDFLIRGRGEFQFKKLIETLEHNKCPVSTNRCIDLNNYSYIPEPNELIWEQTDTILPARNLVERYRARYNLGLMDRCYSLKTSDGCPFKCVFCNVWTYYGGKYYASPAPAVVREIESISGDNIIIVDDNFLFQPKRGFEIARRLEQKGIRKRYFIQSRPDTIVRHHELVEAWKNVGLTMVALGLDGFRDNELERWQKHSHPELGLKAASILNDLGIQSLGEFIIDTDYDRNDFRQLGRFINKSKLTLVQLSILTPLPGTILYTQRRHELTTNDLAKFNIDYPVLPTRLPLSSFFNAIANLYWLSYIYPPALLRRLRLGRFSFLKSLKGFFLVSLIVTHYKLQSWRALFNRLK
ncbi:cobalamin-dependent protein [bacterium]|nr:cobalamin-dependent protein [bacterium]